MMRSWNGFMTGQTDFAGLTHGAGTAKPRRHTHHLLKGFITAIMNPFMIPLRNSR